MNTRWKVVIGVVAALVLVTGGGVWWFLRDDAPEQADLSATASSVAERSTTTAAGAPSTATGPADITGTWSVDAETGEFDYESATGTFAGFRIQENLANIGSTTAVGRTGDVSGTVVIEGTTVSSAQITVDVTTITTNQSRRDDKVQQALETGEFPTATFVLTEPIELGAGAAEGEPVEVTATGDLTVHGVTRQVEFPLQAQLVNGTVIVVGDIEVTFSDYGVEVPSSPIVLSVDDFGTLELQVLLSRQG